MSRKTPQYKLDYCKRYREQNKERIAERERLYRQNNREKVLESRKKYYSQSKEKINDRIMQWTKENPFKRLKQAMKRRAKVKNIEFSLTEQDIKDVWIGICPVFGTVLHMPLAQTGYHLNDETPSLDRIDLTKGYVKGNIQFLSSLANVMKSNATPDQLVTFALWILKTYKGDYDVNLSKYSKL